MQLRWRSLGSLLLGALLLGAAPTSLRFGSDISAAPFEFYQGSSKAPIGFDVELLQAIGAKLGEKPQLVNHQFDDLLAAVRRGTFDAAISAISDTRAREKQVDFIDYFIAGGGIIVPKGNPARIFSLGSLCGYSVTVESGTSYEASLKAQSSDCTAIGLGPVRVVSYATDDQAFAAFVAGKTDAYVADYPVDEYRVRYANEGKALEVAGAPFDVVPYGIAIAKSNAALRNAIRSALMDVIADGTYDKLLNKWGLQRGALRSAPINAGTLFQVK